MTRADLEAQLAKTVAELGDDETRVLLLIGRRLAMGQQIYGRLDVANDSRDWRRELGEEAADALVYAALASIAKEQP